MVPALGARAAARRARAARSAAASVPQGDRHPRRLVRLGLQPRRGAGDAPELRWPAELYLEGSDQHRGWFHSSLLEAVGTRRRPPYKAVLTHGFVVDGDGPQDVEVASATTWRPTSSCPKYGAEVLRLWAADEDYTEDIRLSDRDPGPPGRRLPADPQHLPVPARQPRGLRSARATGSPYARLDEVDRWVLRPARAADRSRACAPTRSTSSTRSSTRVHNFCAVDLSALYLDVIKDRLYTSAAATTRGGARRRPRASTSSCALTRLHGADPHVHGRGGVAPPARASTRERAPRAVSRTPLPGLARRRSSASWDRLLEVRREVAQALETGAGTRS